MLRIKRTQLAVILRHAEEAYPRECCGVLLGRFGGNVRLAGAVVPCQNMRRDSPETRYEIDPRELIRIQREARERQQEIIGFYHSHPDHPPVWSPTDLEGAHWLGCSYLIASVESGEAATARSFELSGRGEDDKSFIDEPIEVIGCG